MLTWEDEERKVEGGDQKNDGNNIDCKYCNNNCNDNQRVNTIIFSNKKYGKNFEIVKNICLKCLNEMNFEF